MIRRSHALLAVTAAGALAASAHGARLVQVTDGLQDATAITAPAGDDRVFVVEQRGVISIVRDGARVARPFLDIRSRVRSGGEQGLLGLAFHPRHAENGRLYVNYTNRAGTTVIAEYRVAGDRDRAVPATARTLMTIRQPFANHNGGDIAFGPDGYLHIGMGDGGSGGDPGNRAQRLDTRLGKMLRIDVDRRAGRLGYAIPRDNPFRGRRGVPAEIFAVGLRNPWRFSFDRTRGDLWIGDVGQGRFEEINFAPPARARGANFGWRRFEGRSVYAPTTRLSVRRYIAPVAVYGHGAGCSVTGGYVYRGPSIPGLDGRYLFSDFCSSRIWSMRAGPRPGDRREITASLGRRIPPHGVRSFGEGGDGTLYVTDGSRLYRFAR